MEINILDNKLVTNSATVHLNLNIYMILWLLCW